MQMLYNSDCYTVVQFLVPDAQGRLDPRRGGYEILDKSARKGVYLDGEMAQRFQRGVRDLAERASDADALDAYIAGYTELGPQPLVLH